MMLLYAAPSDQAPPVYLSVNSSAIQLSWSPPDRPNGVIAQYHLYRNGSVVATTSYNGMTSSYDS